MEEAMTNLGINQSMPKLIPVFDYFYPFLAYMDMRSLSICNRSTSESSSNYSGNKSGLPDVKLYLFGCDSSHHFDAITQQVSLASLTGMKVS
jgi:hypothetical protein